MIFPKFWKQQSKYISREKLIGEWRLIRAEGEMEPDENISMCFHDDGRLTYTHHLEDKDQIILLTYHLDGDRIITDQPSNPRKETTKVSFDQKGYLDLDYTECKAWFERCSAKVS